MGVNSLPKTVTRQRCDCDLNPGPSAPESSTLTSIDMKTGRVVPEICVQTDTQTDTLIAILCFFIGGGVIAMYGVKQAGFATHSVLDLDGCGFAECIRLSATAAGPGVDVGELKSGPADGRFDIKTSPIMHTTRTEPPTSSLGRRRRRSFRPAGGRRARERTIPPSVYVYISRGLAAKVRICLPFRVFRIFVN